MSNIKLYEILGVEPGVSTREIVKAYRIAALKTHPDKLARLSEEEREKAKNSFLQLQHAYEILRDDESRANYDNFGWEGENDDAFIRAYEYYKDPLTSEDIDAFSKTYKSSSAEHDDLLEFYKKHDGDIHDILLYIPLSEASDLDRFVKFYNDKIASDELESTSKYKKSSTTSALKDIKQRYKKKMQKERKRSNDSESLDDLAAQIMANRKKREQAFDSVISNLEKKYGSKKLKK
uniref:DnaJ protein, putative n=1 Tax=Babesia bovis TaxID=5865 RepID=S6BLN3_BABBO|nr:DnaJ protein, putative [Babesia bovis]